MQASNDEEIDNARAESDLEDAIESFRQRKAKQRQWIEAAQSRLAQLTAQHKALPSRLIFTGIAGMAVAVGLAACFALGLRYFWPDFIPGTTFNRRLAVFIVFVGIFALSLGILQRTLPSHWWKLLGELDAFPEYASTVAALRSLTEKKAKPAPDQAPLLDFGGADGASALARDETVLMPEIDLGLDGFDLDPVTSGMRDGDDVAGQIGSAPRQGVTAADLPPQSVLRVCEVARDLIAALNPAGRVLTDAETFALQLVIAGAADGLAGSPDPGGITKIRLIQAAQESVAIDRLASESFARDAIRYLSCATFRSLLAAGRALVATRKAAESDPLSVAILAVNAWIAVKEGSRVPRFAVLMLCKISDRIELERVFGKVEARVIGNFQETAVKREVELYRGTMLGINGSTFGLFDSAQQAAEAAAKIMSVISKFMASRQATSMDIRIAIHSGRLWKEGGIIYGHIQEVVEAMAVKARIRQILVSEPVRSACRYTDLKFAERGIWSAGAPFGETTLFEIAWPGGIEYADIGRQS